MTKPPTRGQSLVEFALIFPLVLFLLLGFFDLGRAVIYYSSLSNAVREGTRAGIVNHVYLEDALTAADTSKAVMTANPVCPEIVDEDLARKNDTLRCIVYRYGFALNESLNPITDIIPTVSLNEDAIYEKITIVANYCFKPITPGALLLVNTTCDGEKGILLSAESTMYVAPTGK